MFCSFDNCNLIIQVTDVSRLHVLHDSILSVDMNMTLTLLILKMSRFLQTEATRIVVDAGSALATVLNIAGGTVRNEAGDAPSAVSEAAAVAAQVQVEVAEAAT